jgi:hypothetical protein
MTNMATWATRVEAWRASGLTSAEFCAGSGFSAGGLRNAAHQLERQAQMVGRSPRVPLARVVRAPAAPTASEAAPAQAARVVIEVGRARVAVAPGADRATLATVLELLTAVAR